MSLSSTHSWSRWLLYIFHFPLFVQDKGLCHSFSKQAELGDNVLDLRDVVVDVVIALAAELTRAEHPVVYLFQGIGPIGHSIEAEIP